MKPNNFRASTEVFSSGEPKQNMRRKTCPRPKDDQNAEKQRAEHEMQRLLEGFAHRIHGVLPSGGEHRKLAYCQEYKHSSAATHLTRLSEVSRFQKSSVAKLAVANLAASQTLVT